PPPPHREAVRDRLCGRDEHRAARRARLARRRHALRFRAHDPDFRAERLHRDRDSGDEAAATDRHDEDLHLGTLLHQLEPDRALPGDDVIVIEGMDQGSTLLVPDPQRLLHRLVVARAVENYVRAESLCAGDLDEGGALRHDDRCGDAETTGMECDPLRVVTGARGNDPTSPVRFGNGQDPVERTPLLEGARPLEVLELEPGVPAEHLAEDLGGGTGRQDHLVGDPAVRLLDLAELQLDSGSETDGLLTGPCFDNLPSAAWQGPSTSGRIAGRPDSRNSLNDPRIGALHAALEQRRPRLLDPDAGYSRASVALLVRPAPHDLEILLIQRPLSERDPWSGHMALPGGRREGDEDALTTAIRETREEVGVDLERDGMLIGRLDEVSPSRGGPQIAVAPFVFAVPSETAVVPDPAEVADTVWIPIRHLADPASAAEHLYLLPGGESRRFPALAYHGDVIWGLTHRMLIQFLGIVRTVREWEAS